MALIARLRFRAGKTKRQFNIVAIDCGAKRNILRHLVDVGCRVTVVPASADSKEIMGCKPDGLFISNGPGDPEPVTYVQKTLRDLSANYRCSASALAISFWAWPWEPKPINSNSAIGEPISRSRTPYTGRVEITSQNHGFAVDVDSMAKANVKVTHVNLNDNTVEGFVHNELPILAVQYHPEASPGPARRQLPFRPLCRNDQNPGPSEPGAVGFGSEIGHRLGELRVPPPAIRQEIIPANGYSIPREWV